ncbi:MAG: dephospho-CoA kinase [Thermoanaerobaculia bacterium]
MILRVGLTGGIASGKSTIARTFAGLGAVTIDADTVVTRLYRPGAAGHEALVRTYGREILRPDGEIDRQKLASIAFTNDEEARKLNALIHPLVLDEERRIMDAERVRFPNRDRIFIVEGTLLLETGGRERYDKIIVVDTDPKTQIERAVKRGMDRGDAERRLARQMPREQRLKMADYVIDNSGNMHTAEVETHRVWEKLWADLQTMK